MAASQGQYRTLRELHDCVFSGLSSYMWPTFLLIKTNWHGVSFKPDPYDPEGCDLQMFFEGECWAEGSAFGYGKFWCENPPLNKAYELSKVSDIVRLLLDIEKYCLEHNSKLDRNNLSNPPTNNGGVQ
jgi:hypothetical protein